MATRSQSDQLNQAAALLNSMLEESVEGEMSTIFRQTERSRPWDRPTPRFGLRQNFNSWAAGNRRRR